MSGPFFRPAFLRKATRTGCEIAAWQRFPYGWNAPLEAFDEYFADAGTVDVPALPMADALELERELNDLNVAVEVSELDTDTKPASSPGGLR